VYHYDLRGSTVALSDAQGAVTEQFAYSPYAGLLSHSPAAVDTPFLYNGRDGVMTDDTGLYYMRARYYDAEIRRFVNQDPLLGMVADGQSLNRYAYVTGEPVRYVDPLGLNAFTYAVGEAVGNPLKNPLKFTGKKIPFVGWVWTGCAFISAYNAYDTLTTETEIEDTIPAPPSPPQDPCDEIRNICIAECSESSLPTSDYGMTYFRCLNACMERHGCL
jgi:RHS repeat-associated protein